MTVRLAALTDADAEPTARWREAARANLRTPYVRSVEEQRAFIRELPAHRYEYRYWAVQVESTVAASDGTGVYAAFQLAGIAGLSPISWENGIAEVSLVLNPEYINQGIGGQAFALLLSEAFDNLRLHHVVAQVYTLNPALGFWRKMAERYGNGQAIVLPHQKFWNGQYHDAEYFSFINPNLQ